MRASVGASVSARAHAKLSTPPLSCHRKVLGAGVHKRVLPPSSGTSKALLPARVDGATGPLVLHTAKGLPSLPSALPLLVFGVREVLSCFRLDFQLDNSCTFTIRYIAANASAQLQTYCHQHFPDDDAGTTTTTTTTTTILTFDSDLSIY